MSFGVDFDKVRTSFDEKFPEHIEKDYMSIIENSSDEQIANVISWFRNKGKFARLVFEGQEPSEIILSEYSFAEISQNLIIFSALALEPERYKKIMSEVYSKL